MTVANPPMPPNCDTSQGYTVKINVEFCGDDTHSIVYRIRCEDPGDPSDGYWESEQFNVLSTTHGVTFSCACPAPYVVESIQVVENYGSTTTSNNELLRMSYSIGCCGGACEPLPFPPFPPAETPTPTPTPDTNPGFTAAGSEVGQWTRWADPSTLLSCPARPGATTGLIWTSYY
jgi:hypothetical protein